MLMLRHAALSIRDFVIVDSLDLEFAPGFTVLTGETGAGKSILIDALALALGERAEAGVVRAGRAARRDRRRIRRSTACRQLAALARRKRASPATRARCLLRRVIDAGGRSRAFINGRAAPLTQLREAGEFLVDIHGQHAHQSLLRPQTQRELLDAYAGAQQLAAAVSAAWHAWQSCAATPAGCRNPRPGAADRTRRADAGGGGTARAGRRPRARGTRSRPSTRGWRMSPPCSKAATR